MLASVCMGAWATMSIGRSRAGEVGESSSHTEHGQSVYLALCSVGTPSSRLFHGPPYLSHVLLLLLPLPPVRMLLLGSLQAHTHTYTHITSCTWISLSQSYRRMLIPALSYRIKQAVRQGLMSGRHLSADSYRSCCDIQNAANPLAHTDIAMSASAKTTNNRC